MITYLSRRKHTLRPDGYYQVCIKDKRYLVHRIVCEHYHGLCPPGYNCNHKDGDKGNNSPDNLEWVPFGRNSKHAVELGLITNNHLKKVSDSDVETIRNSVAKQKDLAIKYGVSDSLISQIRSRKARTLTLSKVQV